MNKSIALISAGLLLLGGCAINCQTRIAVSKSSDSYETWLRHADSDAETVNMYDLGIDSALRMLRYCSGLLLTGGEDVFPGKYGKLSEIEKCEEIDWYRDSLEFALIDGAIELGMPIFGICRGEQILNVALGGTLFTDIPTDVNTAVLHRCPPESENCLHTVNIDRISRLFRIIRKNYGTVNSYHHQAVEKTGPGVRVTATAENGVIEAIEKVSPHHAAFIMGVQWHPEKLFRHPELSYPLAVYFLKQARKKERSKEQGVRSRE